MDETLETILTALSILDDKIDRMDTVLERFTVLLDRFLPLLEKYEKGGAMGMLFGNHKEATWPTPK